jgi:formate--tetrahydrofolate ligase
MHGGLPKARLANPDLAALERGLANLDKHIENIQKFGVPVLVALNYFPTDTPEEMDLVLRYCDSKGVKIALSKVFNEGGKGGEELAQSLLKLLENENTNYHSLYEWKQPLVKKIEIIAREIYGASGVAFSKEAESAVKRYEELGYGELPICMAKTQYSFSDDPVKLGRPTGFVLNIKEVRLSAGAGFVVALAGTIMTMPGLPKKPAAVDIDIDENGLITGLF